MALQDAAKKLDFEGLVITSIITALSFTVGLFWRDAIIATINEVIPASEGLLWKYIIAIGVTILVVVVAYLLLRWQEIQITKVLHTRVKKHARIIKPKKRTLR